MRSYVIAAGIAALMVLAGPTLVRAQEPQADSVLILDPITVNGRVDELTGQVSSASVGYVGARRGSSASA